MNRTSVTSSNVTSVGYDANTLTLEVEFSNGSVYQYFDVPETVYGELLTSASVGRYLNAEVKQSYSFTRL